MEGSRGTWAQGWCVAWLAGILASWGCVSAEATSETRAAEFVSSLGSPGDEVGPGTGGSGGAAAIGPYSDAVGTYPASSVDDGVSRSLGQADFVHFDADRLYALSRDRGLAIIDVSNPTQVRLLGEHIAGGIPFEMYVEDGTVYLMFARWASCVCDGTSTCKWITESRLQALDVRDPAHIQLVADLNIPGTIAGARRAGNLLYLVTAEPPGCHGCQDQPNTAITSFELSGGTPLRQVSQLRVPFAPNQARARLTVTAQRVYIASDAGYTVPGQGEASSSVQVVDISDPSGGLALGARFDVAGIIESSSQLDEHDGIVRVLSQSGGWNSSQMPVLQTFRVLSSSDIQLAASLTLQLPQSVRINVRFDGTRAFASSPSLGPASLLVFDLSEPDAPRRSSDIAMPGDVQQLEPRGDRLLVACVGPDAPEGPHNVSLFDIASLDAPELLSRVTFGSTLLDYFTAQQLGTRPLLVLPEQNLLIVPFETQGSGAGLQLLDFTNDSLTPRASISQEGDQPRRLLPHGDHVLAVSDWSVRAINVSDRDAPFAESSVEMARYVTSVDSSREPVLRFGTDINVGEQRLEVTAPGRVSDTVPLAELSLSALAGPDGFRPGSVTSDWRQRVLRRDNLAYLVHDSAGNDVVTNAFQHRLEILVLDMSEPAEPAAIGSVSVEPLGGDSYFTGVLMTDAALLVGRAQRRPTPATTFEAVASEDRRYTYDVIDVSDPRAPRLASRFEIPEALASHGWGWPLRMGMPYTVARSTASYTLGGTLNAELTAGSLVLGHHVEPILGETARVKFYLDRLDVSSPSTPRLLPSINIPGVVVQYDAAANQLVTLDYQERSEDAGSAEECIVLGYGDRAFDGTHCLVRQHSLSTLRLEGDHVVRQSEVHLDPSLHWRALASSDSRLFLVTSPSTSLEPPVLMLQSFAVEDGQIVQLPAQELRHSAAEEGRLRLELHARGDRALELFNHVVTVVDTVDPGAPRRLVRGLARSDCSGFDVLGDTLYCPGLGSVEVIDLSSTP
jgi:hypothetical protein